MKKRVLSSAIRERFEIDDDSICLHRGKNKISALYRHFGYNCASQSHFPKYTFQGWNKRQSNNCCEWYRAGCLFFCMPSSRGALTNAIRREPKKYNQVHFGLEREGGGNCNSSSTYEVIRSRVCQRVSGFCMCACVLHSSVLSFQRICRNPSPKERREKRVIVKWVATIASLYIYSHSLSLRGVCFFFYYYFFLCLSPLPRKKKEKS